MTATERRGARLLALALLLVGVLGLALVSLGVVHLDARGDSSIAFPGAILAGWTILWRLRPKKSREASCVKRVNV